jgi:16S rRNA (cytidine1402-2'-O)-methyltransferase
LAHLTLVPTPIGNLGDITLRALEVLRAAELVAAEDTRHSGKLLRHYGIDKPLARLDAHTVLERAPKLLAEHASLAYLTDAGTPGISDPGAELLRLALARGDTVEVLPGATALIPALVLSSLPSARFAFEGFLPRKGGVRKARLAQLKSTPYTTVFYEAPTRLLATLRELAEVLGPERRASVSREISKLHEETRRGTLAELLEHFGSSEVRGEVVVVVGPAEEGEDEVDWTVRAEALAAQGLEGKALQKALQALGAPRNEAYELALRFKP